MSFEFGGIEGYSTRIGRVLGGINQTNDFRYTDINSRVSTIVSGYPFTDRAAINDIVGQQDQYRLASTQWLQYLQSVGVSTTILQVNDSYPLVSQTLPVALLTLITEMEANGDAYSRPTCTSVVTPAASNFGNAEVVTSLLDQRGLTLDMVIPETLTAVVTAAAGSGGTAYSEPVSVVGLPFSDGLSYLWPSGSGASATITIANGENASLVSNGGFDTWTSAIVEPTGWTISPGTAGTTVVRSTSNYRGTYSLQFAGNGSQLTALHQDVVANLLPNRVYCLGFWAKRSAGAAAGVLQARLTDSTGTTIQNDQGVDNLLSITVSSGLTTSYAFKSVFFQTPRILPTEVRLSFDLSTAVTNGETVNVDLGSLVAATQLYAGGPFCAIFSGDTQSAQGDYYEIAVTNSHGTGSFIPSLDRIFGLRQLGLRFPSTLGTPVSPDSLISPS